jgi:tRNA-modifying protein YgfZ
VTTLRGRQDDAGATYGPIGDTELVRHYGDVGAEYQAVRRGAGVVVRSDRLPLRMWGRDPVRMLNGLITNDLGKLDAEGSVQGLMLTPKGRVITDLRVVRWPDGEAGELLVEVPAAGLPSVGEHLKKYVPPLFARWEEASERIGILGVYGPRSPEVVSSVLGTAAASEEGQVTIARAEDGTILCIATRYAGGELGFDLIAAQGALPALWDAILESGAEAGARAVGHAALEVLRVEGGRPRYGSELSEEVLPGEALQASGFMERWISFTKGCYTGQEVVIRIAHRGHVNRHLRGLLLGEQAMPAEGAAVSRLDDRKEVGKITSAVSSPLMGQTIALAYVRREVEPGGRVGVGSGDGVVVELPFRAS